MTLLPTQHYSDARPNLQGTKDKKLFSHGESKLGKSNFLGVEGRSMSLQSAGYARSQSVSEGDAIAGVTEKPALYA
jgi:hypothetical protein